MRAKAYGLDVAEIMREVLGESPAPNAGEGGVSSLLSAASNLADKSVSAVEKKRADDKSSADVQVQLDRAIAADVTWAADEALLDLAEQSGDHDRAAAAHALAQSAQVQALQAGVGLPPEAATKRANAARESARQAALDALVSPKDAGKGARMRGWQKVASGALQPYMARSSFFTKVYAGVPVWGLGLGAVALVGGTVLIMRSMRGKRRR